MIFYHVLAHIDFFQNNMMYRHTWNEDFTGRALSDKRFVAMLRSEKGLVAEKTIRFDGLMPYATEPPTASAVRAYLAVKKERQKNEKEKSVAGG